MPTIVAYTRTEPAGFPQVSDSPAPSRARLLHQRIEESENTMKIRTLLGLTVIGSAVYAHKRNGGEFSVESMKKSLHDLWSGIQGKASDAKVTTGANEVLGAAAGKPTEPASPAHSATSDERYGSHGPIPGGLGRDR